MNIERERGKCKYPLLFQPLKVNKIVLKNRIISAPLGSNTDKSLSTRCVFCVFKSLFYGRLYI